MTVLVVKGGHRVPVTGRKAWPLAGLGVAGDPYDGWLPRSIELIGGTSLSYARIYRTQPWVYIVVNKLARGVARLPLKTYLLDGNDREFVRDHPLARLIKRPNPRAPAFRLKEAIVGSLAIYAHALVWKYRPRIGAPPSELWPLNWQHVTIVPGETRPIDGYVYHGPVGRRFFRPEDVIHLEWWGPEGRGVSPLEPLRRTLLMEDAGQRYAIGSFANAARPSGFLKTTRPLDDEEKEELRAELATTHQGPDNAFRIALLEAGMEWEPAQHTAQEAEVIAHRKLNREEVAAVYDIDPTQIGILDRATFSNVTEAHRALYQDTYGPWTTLVEETLDAQLVEEERATWGDVFLEFDFNEVLKGNPRERSEAYQRQRDASVATPNELRRAENRPDHPDPLADELWVPANMVPISQAGQAATAGLASLAAMVADELERRGRSGRDEQ
jgi:HK97 family phage portal protein